MRWPCQFPQFASGRHRTAIRSAIPPIITTFNDDQFCTPLDVLAVVNH